MCRLLGIIQNIHKLFRKKNEWIFLLVDNYFMQSKLHHRKILWYWVIKWQMTSRVNKCKDACVSLWWRRREVKSKKQTIKSPVPVSNIIPLGKEGHEMAFKIPYQWSAVLKKAKTVLDSSLWYFICLPVSWENCTILTPLSQKQLNKDFLEKGKEERRQEVWNYLCMTEVYIA